MSQGLYNQFGRKIGLFIGAPGASELIDLSAFRIRFNVQNADVETPNNAAIRVYNLSKDTVRKIRSVEYTDVILNAGYEAGNYGIIFRGSIKQFRQGRENNTDSYLDIFASDGDIGYNQGVVNTSLAKGATPADAIKASVKAMPNLEASINSLYLGPGMASVPNLRGTVLMGMARSRLRNIVSHLDAGWSIQEGKVVVTPNGGYRDGEAVEINVSTGLIGVPEQTDGGIRVQCLLNSRIRIGGRVKLNNEEITQLIQQNPDAAPIAYNQWAGFQNVAALSPNGMYRAFVVEHEGDTRGSAWYTQLVCLAVNETVMKNISVDPS